MGVSPFIASQPAGDVGAHGDHRECWEDLQCHRMEGEYPMWHLIVSPSLSLCHRTALGTLATLSFEPRGLKVPEVLREISLCNIQ